MKVKKRKKILILIGIILAIAGVGIGGFFAFISYRFNQIPQMAFEDMMSYMTENNEKAIVTVGIVQNGETSYNVYGKDGEIFPQVEHIYEIGSLTKTFTSALLFKAINEGKINLDYSIDKYLDLPEKDYYPTIKRLITHTSGYKSHYFETPMVSNFFSGRNDFYKISIETLIERIGKIELEDRDYEFAYSNFGISVVGAVLSEIYKRDYRSLMNEYIDDELGLDNTRISDGSGDLGKYWDWSENDAYIPAGALISTIEDMMEYAKKQMQGLPEYLMDTHEVLAVVNATSASNAKMNIHVDAVGAAWIIDAANNIVWHNGGTDNYNCYLGFDIDRQIAVVVLSNLPTNYRIPATVVGVKLLADLQKEKFLQ